MEPQLSAGAHSGTTMNVCAVVLAAGAGQRWLGNGHKLLEMFRGKPLVSWAIENAVASDLSVLVIDGAVDLTELVKTCGAQLAHNPNWDKGQATSLTLACDVAFQKGFDAIVVGLGDQPLLLPSAWSAVACADDDHPVVLATYGGVRGHPIRLAASTWPLLDRMGDHGAKTFLSRHPELIWEVACKGSPADIDTVEDLHQWS